MSKSAWRSAFAAAAAWILFTAFTRGADEWPAWVHAVAVVCFWLMAWGTNQQRAHGWVRDEWQPNQETQKLIDELRARNARQDTT